MKKILIIIVFSLLCSVSVFAYGKPLTAGPNEKIFSLTCEGEIAWKYYADGNLRDTSKEIFFEDFDIRVATVNKKKEITEIKMTNSSHHMERDVYYQKNDIGDYKANLGISSDNMQLSLLSLNRELSFGVSEDWKFDKSPARISLKTGVYSGKINGKAGRFTSRYEFRSKCAGGLEIIKYIKSEKNSYLDYWWTVILIIAITFFIFTQSGKRLKQIRRK